MGVGSLLSDHSAREYGSQHEVPLAKSMSGGLIMFVSYVLAGFIPIASYLIFNSVSLAFRISITLSLLALFALGLLIGQVSGTHRLKEAFQTIVLGGLAIGLGVFVGQITSAL